MDAEMSYYGVSDPYDESSRYYKNHLICLWEVTAEEVVGHWKWDDLLKIDCWYEQVILPAFEEHNDKYRVSTETFKLGALWSALFES
jgi:mRNA deadenylase 3'-5' endonuclease subunit Ccr4